MDFKRITVNPKVMQGKPCVRGMRITVELVLNLLANGMSIEEILAEYPVLEAEDIMECLRYGKWVLEGGNEGDSGPVPCLRYKMS